MFEEEAKEHIFKRGPRIFLIDPCMKRLYHVSLSGCAIHFLMKESPDSEMLQRVDYNVGHEGPSALPARIQECPLSHILSFTI